MTTPEITRTELQSQLDRGAPLVLLEALPEPHYLRGHLPGAHNLPHNLVREVAPRLLQDKQAALVVYCASRTCQNSHIAAGVLVSLGYENVRVFAGGKQEWEDAGLALES